MKARLLCKLGEMKGSEFDIDSEATIGRSASNSIVLGSKSVSGEHARIFTDEESGHFVLEDLGSRNGTRLDGKKLRGKQALGGLHVVNFGKSADFVFVVVRETESAAGAQTDRPGKTLVDHESPELPAALRDDPERQERPRGDR